MDFNRVAGNQPYLHLKHVAGVHDAQLVGSRLIQTGVMHPKRLVEKRARMAAPRPAPVVLPIEARLRRVQERRIFVVG